MSLGEVNFEAVLNACECLSGFVFEQGVSGEGDDIVIDDWRIAEGGVLHGAAIAPEVAPGEGAEAEPESGVHLVMIGGICAIDGWMIASDLDALDGFQIAEVGSADDWICEDEFANFSEAISEFESIGECGDVWSFGSGSGVLSEEEGGEICCVLIIESFFEVRHGGDFLAHSNLDFGLSEDESFPGGESESEGESAFFEEYAGMCDAGGGLYDVL